MVQDFLQQLRVVLKESRNTIGLVILILVISVPPLLTFSQPGLIAWGDMDLPELGASRSIEQVFYVWQGSTSFGKFMPLALPEILPHYLLVWLLRQVIGVSIHATQAIMYTLCFELAGLSTFFLVRTILPQRRYFLAALFSGLFYVFNLSFLQITWVGLYMFVFPHAIFPLFLAIYIKGLISGDHKYLAYWAIILFLGIGGLYPLPVGITCAAVLVLYTIFASCIYGKRKWLAGVKYALVGLLAIAIWFLPLISFVLNGGGTSFQSSDLRNFGATFYAEEQQSVHHFINIFRPFYWTWFVPEGFSKDKLDALFPFANSYNTMPILIIGSFLLPVFAFASALFKKNKKSANIIFFLVLAIGFLLFIKANTPPLQQLFMRLNQIPYFSNLFREPFNKSQAPFTLSYAVLAGYTLCMLRIKFITFGLQRQRLLSFVASLLPVGLILALVFPFWQGQLIRPRRVSVPPEYYMVADTLNTDNEEYRVLSLPFFRSVTFVSYRWGYSGATDIMPYLLNHSTFSSAYSIGNPLAEQADTLLRKAVEKGDEATISTLLYRYSMSKILVHLDADPNRYREDFPIRQIEHLMGGNTITFVQSVGDLALYNAESLPYLYATTEVDCIAQDIDKSVILPYSLIRTEGPHRVSVDTCPSTSTPFSNRVFVLAQANAQNGDRNEFHLSVPVSATYELFSSEPVTCLAKSNVTCTDNVWDNTFTYQNNLYGYIAPLKLQPGTYQFQTVAQANRSPNPKQPRPKGILVLRSIEDLHGKTQAPRINYTKVNPTKYQANVEDATSPFLLVLAESYHPSWKAFVDGQELPESTHQLANGYANAWLLDKRGNYQINIEFTPQRLVYIGLAISCSIILISLIYLTYRLNQNCSVLGFSRRLKRK